jgi:hypothetical protein
MRKIIVSLMFCIVFMPVFASSPEYHTGILRVSATLIIMDKFYRTYTKNQGILTNIGVVSTQSAYKARRRPGNDKGGKWKRKQAKQ